MNEEWILKIRKESAIEFDRILAIRKKVIKFYSEHSNLGDKPYYALSDEDKIYFYKEADCFKTDKELNDFINLIKKKGSIL